MSQDNASPSVDSFRVELEALRSDAAIWRQAADDVAVASRHAASMLIEPAAFSRWGVEAGLADTYEQARAQMAQLLSQAGGHFDAIAAALVHAADNHRDEDAAGARRIGGR